MTKGKQIWWRLWLCKRPYIWTENIFIWIILSVPPAPKKYKVNKVRSWLRVYLEWLKEYSVNWGPNEMHLTYFSLGSRFCCWLGLLDFSLPIHWSLLSFQRRRPEISNMYVFIFALSKEIRKVILANNIQSKCIVQ